VQLPSIECIASRESYSRPNLPDSLAPELNRVERNR
jgi:hypothetical protein